MKGRVVAMLIGLLGISASSFAYGPYVFISGSGYLGQFDLATGALAEIALVPPDVFILALAHHPDGHLYGIVETYPGFSLYVIEPATGAMTLVGPTGISLSGGYVGIDLAVDDSGVLWLLENRDLYVVDRATGEATLHCGQHDPDVVLVGLAVVGANLYTMQAHPATLQPLDCGLVAVGVWEDVGVWGYAWLDGSPGGVLFGLKSTCNPGDCTLWSNDLYVLDPGSGDETLIAQHDFVSLTGLAFPPREEQPPTEGIPALGRFGLVLLCGLTAGAGVLALRLRHRP